MVDKIPWTEPPEHTSSKKWTYPMVIQLMVVILSPTCKGLPILATHLPVCPTYLSNGPSQPVSVFLLTCQFTFPPVDPHIHMATHQPTHQFDCSSTCQPAILLPGSPLALHIFCPFAFLSPPNPLSHMPTHLLANSSF